MKIRATLSFLYLHDIISDFCETSHALNRNILLSRDKTIRVRKDSFKRCEEIFKWEMSNSIKITQVFHTLYAKYCYENCFSCFCNNLSNFRLHNF